jgi:hypothetical protein
MTYKTILGIVPGLQATALVAENIPKNICPTPGKKIRSQGMGRGLAIGRGRGPIGRMRQPIQRQPIQRQPVIKQGVKTLIAIPIIGATAGMINKL